MKTGASAVLSWVALALGALAAPPGALASDRGALDAIFGSWQVSQATLGSKTLVRSFEIQESVEFVGTSQPRMDVHIVRTRAGHFRFELTRPGVGAVVQAYDGRLGWQAQAQWGLGLAANLPSDAWVWQNNLLVAASSFRPRIDYRALPPAQVNGRPCIVAAVTDAGKLEGKCFFDRENHRLLRIERQAAAGSAQTLAMEFDDFR